MKIDLIIYLLFYCLSVFSQNKTDEQKLAELVVAINNFNHLYPQEKVYLHFDNTGYYLGETIWFKAYISVAEDHRLSEISKVLYVELLTPEGKVVETQKLKIENGQARGGFLLKNRYFSGYYQVRAYTRCMLNFGEDVIFSRVFPVYDPANTNGIYEGEGFKEINIKPRNMRKEEKTNDLNLAFFPEGGHLITGIANRVAFKVTDKEGKALDITGKIDDTSNNEITSFKTLHLGMGSFVLNPDGKKQIAKIRYNNKEYTFDLPASKPEGYAMRVENLQPETLSVQVEKTAKLPAQLLGITFACRGRVYAIKALEPDSSGLYTLDLEKTRLPSGLIQITLFTPQGEVLAQRQAFVNNGIQALPVRVKHIKTNFEPLSPIDIAFEIKDGNHQAVETTFSLSVRDEATEVSTNYTDNILYNLLLSSDLKGYIENPAYYFEADDDHHRLALDLLMLVQGWTRYSWKQAAGVEPFVVKYWIEKSLMIDGSVLAFRKPFLQEDVEVTIWMTSHDGWSQQGQCITDKEGRFNFELADLTGPFELNLRAKAKDNKGTYRPLESRITLDRIFSPVPFAFAYYETHPVYTAKNESKEVFVPDKPMKANVETKEIDIQEKQLNESEKEDVWSYVLPEVEVKGKMSSRRALLDDPRFTVYDVAREIDHFIDKGENVPDNVLDFLVSVDPYYSYTMTAPLSDRDRNRNRGEYGGPGMRILSYYNRRRADFFVNTLTSGHRSFSVTELSMNEIEYISISNNSKGDGTPINILLNESAHAKYLPKGLRKTYFDGFAYPREFYSPDYSMATLPEPDVRRTLYWNPDVKTDRLGHASVLFYNNGTCKKLSISAEGLTDGNVPVMYNGNED